MLTREQAEAASEFVLSDGRRSQEETARRIETRYRPFSTFLRYFVTAATGLLAGGIFGSSQMGAFFPACLVGLLLGAAYGFFLGQMQRRREV